MPSSKYTQASSGYNVTVVEKRKKNVYTIHAPQMFQKKKK